MPIFVAILRRRLRLLTTPSGPGPDPARAVAESAGPDARRSNPVRLGPDPTRSQPTRGNA